MPAKPKAAARKLPDPCADIRRELRACKAELKEARAQQAAVGEVLRIISDSPTDTQPVFDAIVKSGVQLFGGMNMSLRLVTANRAQTVASTEPLRGSSDSNPVELGDESVPTTRAMLRREVVQVPDILAPDEWVSESAIRRGQQRGWRAIMNAPLLREDNAIGAIAITREAPGPFTEKQINLLKTFASQAVIAIENVRLFKEIQARNAELSESLEQQTATSEILRIISSSPTDLQPVFDTIIRNATNLCTATRGSLRLFDDRNLIRLVSEHGSPTPFTQWRMQDDAPQPGPSSAVGQVIAGKCVVHIADLARTPAYADREPITVASVDLGGTRTLLAVPMLKEEALIGVIIIHRQEVNPFTAAQIELVKTFADQAVIAIEHVRLFKELEARNAELTEALEQQTATAEILRVISSSPTDTQPVFDAIVKSGARLFDGANVGLRLLKADRIETVASTQPVHDTDGANPVVLGDESMPTSRAMLRREVVQIPDTFAPDAWVSARAVRRGAQRGWRALMNAPLLREGHAIGAIAVTRATPGPFTQKQITLVKTFADQAVIAIENVRLFNETKEALDRQTATAEILRVISDSPTDATPVFQAVAERAMRICDASNARVFLVDGSNLRCTGDVGGTIGGNVGVLRPLNRGSVTGRAVIDGMSVHVADLKALPPAEYPHAHQLQSQFGHRTVLAVPLMVENQALGAIVLHRMDVRPFDSRQVASLETFSDQAAIAIANVRLFTELQARNADLTEALEQQTATANVLKVISRSTFDLDPVLETLAENARKLCNADRASILRAGEDGNYRSVVVRPGGEPLAYLQRHPLRPDRGSAVGRAVVERQTVHIPDVRADPEFTRSDLADLVGFRTALAVPMLREGEPTGVFLLTRSEEVRPFTDKQIEVVTTFADQAVIAIENVRLFDEIQEKSRQLEIANRHKSQFLANMSHELRTPLNCINGFSEMLLERMFGELNEKQEEFLRDIHSSGEHLLSLINDVLDLSKIEAGRMELHLTDFDPGITLDNTVMLVKERAASRGVALNLTVDDSLERWVGDERKIRQVMLNLLSNAVKFTPAGGRIDVSAAREGNDMVVAVSDTGIGIKPEDQERIFEEFQQAGSDYTKKAEGTGLGLALSRGFVELHGGTLRVQSAQGAGSTFTFKLPQMQAVTS